jgi:hypothetical protein
MQTHWAKKRTGGYVTQERKNVVSLDRSANAQQGLPHSKHADMTIDQLLPQDVELARLGQIREGDVARSSLAKPELEARTSYLVSKGYGVRQGDGIGFKPDAWAKLRDADIARALERQLGVSGRNISQGLSEGVVIGSITTSVGKQTVIDRGVGIAIAPASNGNELAIGHVIGGVSWSAKSKQKAVRCCNEIWQNRCQLMPANCIPLVSIRYWEDFSGTHRSANPLL